MNILKRIIIILSIIVILGITYATGDHFAYQRGLEQGRQMAELAQQECSMECKTEGAITVMGTIVNLLKENGQFVINKIEVGGKVGDLILKPTEFIPYDKE